MTHEAGAESHQNRFLGRCSASKIDDLPQRRKTDAEK